MSSKIYNVNVVSKTNLSTPADINASLPMSDAVETFVLQSRQTICDIVDGGDSRLFVVVGPCSIHDVEAAHDYASRLRRLAADVSDVLFVLMRVYFEKPRTTESQTHREMASGLSTPVGFKNGTDGSLKVAINALESARQPHHFLGINQEGQPAVFHTRGNPYGHVVLRGGAAGPNYDPEHVDGAAAALREANLPDGIVVDCSHANSNKDPEVQPVVARNCVEQVVTGNSPIIGLMLESHLGAGNQKIPANLADLQYGVSVTDGCIDWATTERTLSEAADSLRRRVT